ncbi:hypothetical protein [Methanopyrus sp.]
MAADNASHGILEKIEGDVLEFVNSLSKLMEVPVPTEVEVPKGCRVIWEGESLIISSEEEDIEVRLDVPSNVRISPKRAVGPAILRIHVDWELDKELENKLVQALKRFRERLAYSSPNIVPSEDRYSEVSVVPIFEVDAATLLEMEYSALRISYIMGKAELKRAFVSLALTKAASVTAARNLAEDPSGIQEGGSSEAAVLPYLRVGRKITRMNEIPLSADEVFTIDSVPSDVKVIWMNWKYLPRVMAWGLDGITARQGWERSDIAVAHVDVLGSLYSYHLSTLLDLPSFDLSYMLYLKYRSKLPKRKLWKDDSGSHYLFWTQLEAFERLDVETLILIVTKEECEGWVRECVEEDAGLEVIEVYGDDPKDLVGELENLLGDMGEEINGVQRVEVEPVAIKSRTKPKAERPVPIRFYREVAELATRRVLPEIHIKGR